MTRYTREKMMRDRDEGIYTAHTVEKRMRDRDMKKLKVPKVTPTTYASSTKKALKQRSKKKWKV